jgi:hypothetical protein
MQPKLRVSHWAPRLPANRAAPSAVNARSPVSSVAGLLLFVAWGWCASVPQELILFPATPTKELGLRGCRPSSSFHAHRWHPASLRGGREGRSSLSRRNKCSTTKSVPTLPAIAHNKIGRSRTVPRLLQPKTHFGSRLLVVRSKMDPTYRFPTAVL